MLEILVENQGHINYGSINDPKGLVNNVTIDGQIILEWTMVHITFKPNDFSPSNSFVKRTDEVVTGLFQGKVPAMPSGTPPQDTFLLLNGWNKVCMKLTFF